MVENACKHGTWEDQKFKARLSTQELQRHSELHEILPQKKKIKQVSINVTIIQEHKLSLKVKF